MVVPRFGHFLPAVLACALVTANFSSPAHAAIATSSVQVNSWQLTSVTTAPDTNFLFLAGIAQSDKSRSLRGDASATAEVGLFFDPLFQVGDSVDFFAAANSEVNPLSHSAANASAAVNGMIFLLNLSGQDLSVTLEFLIDAVLDVDASVTLPTHETSLAEASLVLVDADGNVMLDSNGDSIFEYDILADGVNGPGDVETVIDETFAVSLTVPVGGTWIGLQANANTDVVAAPEPGAIVIWSLLGVVGLAIGRVRRRRAGR